ncbi:hypothetical protein MJO28_004801 [Puccinia striiformis f. sp. tritici]|uniref:Uncharacterized protein n=5 Tax=Puccinia striiformis TaxID=27350 RepID=A0A0L0VMR3_9BASI|nr:hypothetical protein Pst134EA_009028 [Puccinia striiformis f. sp. tritici]KAI9609574.1 hypothetical protein H4Q26_007534 [Puccinia striiformis f. sp. tritici PST-130]KNF00564.1 hypothetical protein PSTG_06257 [Puccinia striiformis f. sp. tritici PST-78]POW05428.1 hypothetical protein PSHT_10754 [Puccinia striiformis]KAH9457732.1 hypothetical protein Pst134EB_010049 [Puccinia striiformis f. sp. tritici]KAH9468485.1 hypothetical protein Pst134EA_009028 [Puccinia striiformis f. sp. tritici]
MFMPVKEASSSSLFQTDVRRRTNLSTATNALRSAAVEAQNDSLGLSSEERLAEMEDELNRIVDRDVETLVEGMEEILELSSVGAVDKLRALQDSLAIELRTETLVRSCTSLMALSHSMKMLWLLGDEANGRKIQDAQTSSLNSEIVQLKSRAAQLIEELKLNPSVETTCDHEMNLDPSPPSSSSADQPN